LLPWRAHKAKIDKKYPYFSLSLLIQKFCLQLLMERAPLLRLKREIEASGDEEAVEPQEDHHDLNGDQHDPEAGGDREDHPQVEPDGDEAADGGDDDKADADGGDDDKADADEGDEDKADADEGDDDKADADEGDDDKADGDGGHLEISETEEAEASGDDHIIDYLRE
jgi:hypothetical protein